MAFNIISSFIATGLCFYLRMFLVYVQGINATPIFSKKPIRIISLVPSQTELLFDLGLDDLVVGITKFCVHPPGWLHCKKIVGGTKNVNIDKIKSLNPDLVLANKEENVQEQIEALAEIAPVWVSDIQNLQHALSMIRDIGGMTNTQDKAIEIINKIEEGFKSLTRKQKGTDSGIKRKAAYIIWQNPLITIGHDTFIHSMMEYAGFENVFENRNRYPQTTIEELQILFKINGKEENFLMLSSEPFPFKEDHAIVIRQALPDVQVILVNGEFFSWYGSRLQLAPLYFKKLQGI